MARKLVIFDVDGTLVYSERRDSRCFADTYQTMFGQALPSIDWTQYPHVTDTTIFQTVFTQHFARQARPEELHRFEEAYLRMLRSRRVLNPGHSREVPGARAAVERLLEDERFVVGIATGGWRRPAIMKLEYVGIPAHRIPLRGADGLHTREQILEDLIRTVGVQYPDISSTVYLGDAVWDVQTTANLGLGFLGIRWRGDKQVLEAHGARAVLRNYLNFEGFLDCLQQARPPRTPGKASPDRPAPGRPV